MNTTWEFNEVTEFVKDSQRNIYEKSVTEIITFIKYTEESVHKKWQ